MRAIVHVFLTLPTKTIPGSVNDKKTSSIYARILIHAQRSFSENLRLLGLETRELWIIKKETLGGRVSNRASSMC